MIGPMKSAIEMVRGAVMRDAGSFGDGELLGRYIERREEAAFAALVERHGPMVWSVCRRTLNRHDAEDAFQATFLVLVRKAATVAPREMVGSFLYGVAHRATLLARRTAARRRAREVQVTTMPEPEVAHRDQWSDVRPVLDQELSRLPDIYRVVVVLCDLEGRSRKEVAKQLGVPEGTIAGRLARARTLLSKRLRQQGIALSAGALATLLSSNAEVAVPGMVASSTINAAGVYAAGQAAAGLLSAPVAALTEGVLKAMLVSKLKIASVVMIVCLGCLGVPAAHLVFAAEKTDAREKADSSQTYPDVFAGKWTIADRDSLGPKRVLIDKNDDGWTIQTWDVIDDKEVASDKIKLDLLFETDSSGSRDENHRQAALKYGFARTSDKIANRYMTLRVEKDVLVVEWYNIYNDDRGHRHLRVEFKKAE